MLYKLAKMATNPYYICTTVNDANLWSAHCDNEKKTGKGTLFWDKRKAYCALEENLTSGNCQKWCSENLDHCPMYKDCDIMKLIGPACNKSKVEWLRKTCNQYGLTIGDVNEGVQLRCTEPNVIGVLDDCTELNIDPDKCTVSNIMLQTTIQNANSNTAKQIEAQKEAAELSTQTLERIAAAFLKVMNSNSGTFVPGTGSATESEAPKADLGTVHIGMGLIFALNILLAISVVFGLFFK